MSKKKTITHQQMEAMNWRYKKKVAPTHEHAHLNGEVKVTKPSPLPHPLKCSKCDFIAKSVKESKESKESKEHWLDHD